MKRSQEKLVAAMTPKYVIHTDKGTCNCFSEAGLLSNLKFARAEGWRVVGVERVI